MATHDESATMSEEGMGVGLREERDDRRGPDTQRGWERDEEGEQS